MRKLDFCLFENGTDHLCSNCRDDQCLCFGYMDGTIPLLSKFETSSFKPSSVAAQAGLCQTLSKTLKTFFLVVRLIYVYQLTTKGVSFSS